MQNLNSNIELSEAELKAVEKPNEKLSEDDRLLIMSAIEKQNRLIDEECKEHYMLYLVQYFSDPHNASFLRALNICLYEYRPSHVRDIIQIFADMYEIRWTDIGWRKDQYMYHQRQIQQVISSDDRLIKKNRKLKSYISYFNEMIKDQELNGKIEPISDILKGMKNHDAISSRIMEEINILMQSGFTQNEISVLSGISLQKIKKFSSQVFPKKVKEEDLLKFAEAFDCSVYYLLGKTPDRLGIHSVFNNEVKDKNFAAVFDDSYVDLEQLIKYLMAQYNDLMLKRLFVIIRIMDKRDAEYFQKMIISLSKFIDNARVYINPDLPEDDPQKEVIMHNFQRKD